MLAFNSCTAQFLAFIMVDKFSCSLAAAFFMSLSAPDSRFLAADVADACAL